MPFDTDRFTMERVEMVRQIQSMKTTYDLTAQEFSTLVDILHDKMVGGNIPESARHCEDVLYEIFARMLKGYEWSQWFATKMRTEVLCDLDPELAMERLQATKALDRSQDQGDILDSGPIKVFLTYEYLYRTNKTDFEIPSFSAISAIKEMIIDNS
jgi:hypothetical protein